MAVLLKRNKKLWVVLVMGGLMTIGLFVAASGKKTPVEQTQLYCLENIKDFQAQLDTFQQLAEQHSGREQLLRQFKRARISFKRFEFICEYYDNARHPFFNGANAMELEYGYSKNAKPEGLQVMESELFSDSLDMERIIYLTKQLKYRTLSFYIILRDAELKDAFIFEAIRFHLIRIETLSLVSFDSPDIRNNVAEISAALKSFRTILDFYREETAGAEFTALQVGLTAAADYLGGKSFDQLDRLVFIKKHLQPLVKQVMDIQQSLAILYLEETHTLFRVVNLKAATIYDADFLNPRFYAEDKYYKNNPLYGVLGKKLFFDKRLSADGSMSCATCHQPQAFFTDQMPVGITNQPGQFQQRHTPGLLNAALQAGYFYDMRANTLENQIGHVVQNPLEFNNSYPVIISRLKADTQYVRLFLQAFPEQASDTITAMAVNTCIADFERQFTRLNTSFDRYMRGQSAAIDPAVKRGFNLFMGKAQCGACHFAPSFFGTVPPFYGTSESEVLGLTKTFDTIHPVLDDDIGRFKQIEADFFKFSIKTSTVRNAEVTAPYMHNGGFRNLEEVLEFYNRGGGAGMGLDIPNQTLPADKLNLTAQEKKDIITFIKALTDTSGISSLE